MCMEAKDCNLRARVDAIDERLTKVETNMASGFTTVTNAVNQLAHDFGTRMNAMDAKLVEEKTRWGECFRSWLGWIVKLLIVGCGAAMGLTAYKMIFPAG